MGNKILHIRLATEFMCTFCAYSSHGKGALFLARDGNTCLKTAATGLNIREPCLFLPVV